jgi:hypothetical protein
MTHFQRVNVVGLSLLLAMLLMTPGALPGQTTAVAPPQATKTPASVAPSALTPTLSTPAAAEEECLQGNISLEVPLEQIGDAVRSIDSTIDQAEIERAVRQELRESLADLSARVRQEVQMSSP